MEKNPRSASDAVTVFLDTSLDTHLAVTVCGNDTVSELKRKLENEHQLCIGEIKIRSLKVNRRGCFYHLSDSMCVKGAVSGVDKECFLFADASSLEKNGEIQHGSHNFGSNNQLICFGISNSALVNGMDRSSDVPSKSLCNVDDSIRLLLEGNKHNIADQNGSVDSGRETSKDLEMGIKYSDEDHCRTSFNETIHRPEPEIREDRGVSNDGFRVPTTQEHKEDTSRKDVSEAKSNASLENASPAKNGQQKDKQKCEETVHLNENDAPVHRFEEQSQVDILPPQNSLVNESRDVSCDMMIGSKDTSGREVPCDSVVGEKNSTEEPCRASASNMDNRSGSGILRTNDAYKETEVSEKHTECRKDTHCNTAVEDVSISQPASKKKCKFEEVTDLEDSLKENNILICDSNEEASKPEIASELSAEKNASTIFDGSLAETSDFLTSSSSRKKMKKKKKSLNSLQQAVDAAPSRRGDMEERSVVASAGINDKNSGGEDVASINGQDLKENHCAAIQELQENHKVPSSHDVNGATDAGNVEHKSDASEEKSDGHLPVVVKAPSEGGTNSAERVQEERESSQTNDSETMLSEKCKLPGHGKKYGNDAKVIETSELLDTNGTVTPSKKKRKRKKITDSIEESLIISGAEHIIVSECDISLAEPHEAVYGEQVSDTAKKQESNISQKNGKDISEKETGHCRLVEADNLDVNEVETLPQIAESKKRKSKRKHDAMTKDLHKLEAEEENVSHQDPVLTTDNRTEALTSKRKKSKLAKTTPIDQSNEKCLESVKEYGVHIDTLRACSNSMSVSTKVPSHAPEHISEGTSLEANLSGNVKEVSCEGEEINFHKYMVPSQSQNEVVASGEMHAQEVTRSKILDNKMKPKKNRKMLDSSSRSSDLQSPLKSHDNQGIGGKSEPGKSSSIQPQGSISKDGGVVPEPEKTVPKKVSKSGTRALSSDASGKKNLIPKAAGKHREIKTLAEERNEDVSVSNSKTEKSNKKDQSKTGKKRQSGATQNVEASGKASGNDNGEVLNSSKTKKSSATSVAPGDRNGIVEGKDGVVDSDASTTSSDYSLSSESDYSDGESNAGSCASSGKKGTGRSSYSGIKGKPARRLKNDEIFLNSSVYKKAKLAASQSQQEEDSQAPEFVPDSQPVF